MAELIADTLDQFYKADVMQLETAVNLCGIFHASGLAFWLDGGWGVDALLGEQTRVHSDLDLAVQFSDLCQFERIMLPLGYRRSSGTSEPYWNWVLHHPTDGSVDLHGFVLNAEGEGVLGDPSANAVYPAGALDGVGKLGAMPVKCIAAHFVLMFRNGFEPRAVDHHDVDALCRRFNLKRPSRFL